MNSYAVDIAMMKVVRSPDQLYSLGLGSCVGVAIFDPAMRIGGLIHVLLPSSLEFEKANHVRTKFADSGIHDLVNELIKSGASKFRLKAKMAGGAAMFTLQNAMPNNMIGKRNVVSCRETLKNLGIDIISQDIGGNKGRTIIFDVETGQLTVRMVDRSEKII